MEVRVYGLTMKFLASDLAWDVGFGVYDEILGLGRMMQFWVCGLAWDFGAWGLGCIMAFRV